jgi:CheY-like chemotaxis protein
MGWFPDLVLMDYHLDQTSGLDAIEWLRHNVGGHLPAALVTADRNTREISMVLSTLRSEAACLPARPIESSRVLTSRTDAARELVLAEICIDSASGVLIRGQP